MLPRRGTLQCPESHLVVLLTWDSDRSRPAPPPPWGLGLLHLLPPPPPPPPLPPPPVSGTVVGSSLLLSPRLNIPQPCHPHLGSVLYLHRLLEQNHVCFPSNQPAAPRALARHMVQPSCPLLFVKSQTQSCLRAFAHAVPLPGHLPSDCLEASTFCRLSDLCSLDGPSSPPWIKPYPTPTPTHITLSHCLETGLQLAGESERSRNRGPSWSRCLGRERPGSYTLRLPSC